MATFTKIFIFCVFFGFVSEYVNSEELDKILENILKDEINSENVDDAMQEEGRMIRPEFYDEILKNNYDGRIRQIDPPKFRPRTLEANINNKLFENKLNAEDDVQEEGRMMNPIFKEEMFGNGYNGAIKQIQPPKFRPRTLEANINHNLFVNKLNTEDDVQEEGRMMDPVFKEEMFGNEYNGAIKQIQPPKFRPRTLEANINNNLFVNKLNAEDDVQEEGRMMDPVFKEEMFGNGYNGAIKQIQPPKYKPMNVEDELNTENLENYFKEEGRMMNTKENENTKQIQPAKLPAGAKEDQESAAQEVPQSDENVAAGVVSTGDLTEEEETEGRALPKSALSVWTDVDPQVTRPGSHGFQIGSPSASDVLLYKEKVHVKPKFMRSSVTYINFPKSRKGSPVYISGVQVVDERKDGKGGMATISSGGIGSSNVVIKIKSEFFREAIYTIYVYGKQMSKY